MCEEKKDRSDGSRDVRVGVSLAALIRGLQTDETLHFVFYSTRCTKATLCAQILLNLQVYDTSQDGKAPLGIVRASTLYIVTSLGFLIQLQPLLQSFLHNCAPTFDSEPTIIECMATQTSF